MSTVGQREIATQQRLIALITAKPENGGLGYAYRGAPFASNRAAPPSHPSHIPIGDNGRRFPPVTRSVWPVPAC
ncbi:MAG: hypothetical protein H0T88_03350 [Lysobacter sp.]|nr:hypothetical protein [Lysobacter sp.]